MTRLHADPGSDPSHPTPPRGGPPWRRLAVLGVLAAAVAAFFLLGGHRWLTLEAVRDNRDLLLAYTQTHYATVLLVAMLVYMAATALSLPGATVLTLAMGFLFGRWVGTAAVVVAATAGATAAFLVARYLLGEWARRRLGIRAERVAAGFERDAFHYLLFLRLVPLFPFWLVNLAPAFTSVRTRTFLAATGIGIIPGTFVFVNLGESLGRIESAGDLLSARVLVALSLLGALALLPVLVRSRRGSLVENEGV
jgi:uncharacterized membrane protein YdjX (TVP38/TMEM64 family)